MKVSDFPNEAPSDGTKVPVIGEKHFTIEQLVALLDQRYVQSQPAQAVSGTGTATTIKGQQGANGDETGGGIIIESGRGGPEHGSGGDILIQGSVDGGNIDILAGNAAAIGQINIGLRNVQYPAFRVTQNNQVCILGTDQVLYALDVVNGQVTASALF